jgi:hypothetical protein
VSGKSASRILKTLESGAHSYSELQQRSGVRPGSFGRVTGTLMTSEQVIRDPDGRYRLPRPGDSWSDSSESQNDSPAIVLAAESDSGDSPTDSEPIAEEPVPTSGLRAWTPEGIISWEEHRRRKGYVDD